MIETSVLERTVSLLGRVRLGYSGIRIYSDLLSAYSAPGSRIGGMKIQVFRNKNSSQTNAYFHYSYYSHSGLVPNECALNNIHENVTWFWVAESSAVQVCVTPLQKSLSSPVDIAHCKSGLWLAKRQNFLSQKLWKRFLKWEKMALRKIFRHFLHANFLCFYYQYVIIRVGRLNNCFWLILFQFVSSRYSEPIKMSIICRNMWYLAARNQERLQGYYKRWQT